MRKPEINDHLEDLHIFVTIILTWILNEGDIRLWTGFI